MPTVVGLLFFNWNCKRTTMVLFMGEYANLYKNDDCSYSTAAICTDLSLRRAVCAIFIALPIAYLEKES